MTETLRLEERLIMSGFNYAYGIGAVDMTGNGVIDLVAADTNVGLYWFENDGAGNFTRHVIHLKPAHLDREWLERFAIADVDGDGRPEIVIVDNWNGRVLCFDCEGDPRDTAAWRIELLCDGHLPGAYDVAVADLDGDGQIEVAASSWVKSNRFVILDRENGRWVQHVIDDAKETRTICVADFDGDGRPDLLGTAAGSGEVIWYENPGSVARGSWRKHIVDIVRRPCHGHPVDMIGAGRPDVIMASGFRGDDAPGPGEIAWYENPGDPTRCPWPKHVICADFPEAFEAVAADVDGDGRLEVIATGWGPHGCVTLFKHDGDPRGAWSMQSLKNNWSKANQVIVAHLTDSGLPDIVACAERGSNELRWWRNLGAVQ